MKINNRGWGYTMMIFLMSILCLFLAIAIYFIYRFYSNFEYIEKNNTYIKETRSI